MCRTQCSMRDSFAADLDNYFSASGPVEFTEKNALPCAQSKSPVLYQDLFTAAEYRAFAVRIRIALGMTIAGTMICGM